MKITDKQRSAIAAALLEEIAKKCLIDGKTPRDFLGITVEVPLPNGGGYFFEIKKNLVLAVEDCLKAVTQDAEEYFLKDTSGDKHPKGFMSEEDKA